MRAFELVKPIKSGTMAFPTGTKVLPGGCSLIKPESDCQTATETGIVTAVALPLPALAQPPATAKSEIVVVARIIDLTR